MFLLQHLLTLLPAILLYLPLRVTELIMSTPTSHRRRQCTSTICICSKIFESVLDAWCMLPGGSEMPKEVQEFVSDAFSLLFEAPPMQKENSFKNRDHIDLSVDHQLSKLYRQAMKAVHAIVLGELGGGNC